MSSLWRNRRFNAFWVGQALSNLGDGMAWLALPLLVYRSSGSVAKMGLVTTAVFAGQWLACLFAGSLVDRFDRRRVMIACDIGRVLIQGYLALGFSWRFDTPGQALMLYVMAGLGAMLGTVFSVAHVAVLPSLVPREQLTAGNARLQGTEALASIAGPALGGLIAASLGPTWVIGLDALSFLGSALALSLVRFHPVREAPSAPREPGRKARLWDDLAIGFTILRGQPVLWATSLLICGFKFMTAGGFDLLIFRLKNDLQQSDSALGLVFSVASVGGILGAVFAGRLRERLGFGSCYLGSFVLAGLSGLLLAQVRTAPLLGLSAMGYGMGNAVLAVLLVSLRQQLAPEYLLGRVTSALWTMTLACNALGAASVTSLASHYGAPRLLALMGAVNILLALVGLLTAARQAEPLAQPAPALTPPLDEARP